MSNQRSILIVEDNQTLRRLLEYRLGKQYLVRSATNGEDALRMIEDSLPDLIVSDIMMPKMDGFALLNLLRRDERTKTIPFIFLTAKSDDTSRVKGMSQGVDDYITKPFDIDYLLSRIEKILERTQVYQTRLSAKIGRDFSDQLLPKSMPTAPGYQTRFISQPKDDGGGDFIDWVEVRPGVFLLTISDIMGKGIQAKFYAFSFLSYIRSSVHAMAGKNDSPADLMTHVNQVLAKDGVLKETFASMLIIRWDSNTGVITYCNAGHCRPIVIMEDRVGVVEYSEMILGLNPNESYSNRSFTLPPGAALAAYTDGLVEQPNYSNEAVGEAGLLHAARGAFGSSRPVHKLLENVLSQSPNPAFTDDVLVFWLEREKEPQAVEVRE